MERYPAAAQHLIRANKLIDEERHREALPLIEAFLTVNPQHVYAWATLGSSALKLHDAATAERAFRSVLDIDPNHIGALNAMANVECRRYDFETAEHYARRAFDLHPNAPASFGNLGSFLVRDGRYEEARDLFEEALRISPGDHMLKQGLGLVNLALGHYRTGYRLRARDVWERNDHRPGRKLPAQLFDLTGRQVYLFPDEGHGDCVAMARFIPRVKRLGGRVFAAARGPLKRLWAGVPGADEVIDPQRDVGGFETAMSMICLPGYFHITPETVPPPVPFKLPHDAVTRARRITAPFQDSFKVGFCWSGSGSYVNNYARSTTHDRFLPFASVEGVKLFSLYKGEYLDAYLHDPAARDTVDASSSDADYADAVALIAEMDLVITVDTCIAHLAGTMGKPTWIMIHKVPYYYFDERFGDQTPWYPSARIFRQPDHGDWETPFASARSALEHHVSEWRTAR